MRLLPQSVCRPLALLIASASLLASALGQDPALHVRDLCFELRPESRFVVELQTSAADLAAAEESLREACREASVDTRVRVGEDDGDGVRQLILRDPSDEERTFVLAADRSIEGLGDVLRGLFDSSLATRLPTALASSQAVLLVCAPGEGPDGVALDAAVDAALERVRSLRARSAAELGGMPEVIRWPLEECRAERALLFCMGLELDELEGRPAIVVLTGRGQRLGAPISGPEIDADVLFERVALTARDPRDFPDSAMWSSPRLPLRFRARSVFDDLPEATPGVAASVFYGIGIALSLAILIGGVLLVRHANRQ